MIYKIVIVEDETYLRRGLVATTDWERFDCRIIAEFASPAEAVAQIPSLNPDIVITDIRMPSMTGLEMIGRLREKMDCVYIIISGFDDFAYAQQSIEMGVVGYLLKPIDDDELEKTLWRAVEAVEGKRHLRQLQATAEVGASIVESAPYFAFEKSAGSLKDNHLQKAIRIIADHYAEDISVKWLASAMNVSESYLFKLFKSMTGYTILEWITHYRMKQALTLMQEMELRIYEIAGQVGYKDVRYFSSMFKKHFGVTPTEYRNAD